MLDSKHIKDGFRIDDSLPEKFISIEVDAVLARRCKPRDGDILISSRGSIGKIAIVSAGQNFNIMGNMILVRLPERVNRQFAAFYLLSQVSAIESIAQGFAQKGLYLSQIREFKIPLPSAATQAKTGERLWNIWEETERLSNTYRGKLTSLDELKQSLLAKAFAGELT
jgi:type I restriction enzyme S subunit